MKNKRGPAEQTFEEIITTRPISSQHNPWHDGALNGNGIERLLESVEWVFQHFLKSNKCGVDLQRLFLSFVQQY
jgi:hypothetical protein